MHTFVKDFMALVSITAFGTTAVLYMEILTRLA